MATRSDRIGKQVKKVTKDLHKMNGIARKGAQKNLRKLGENASGYHEQVVGKMHRIERRGLQIIQNRPLGAALIAAGIGLALGAFWLRRLTMAR
jgi:ElaB/YqjD/DUF883 family membrane-anchored ribosome-binding protein